MQLCFDIGTARSYKSNSQIARVLTENWAADVLKAVRDLGKTEFVLDEVYAVDEQLQKLHPDNKHVRPKIRQQLQILRDKGILEFKGTGRYRFRET